ncbi:MAG TPA: cytochrome c [Acetobacteraceae bacterium]|nr:cytochrome c [Acetobacteraceae bacterium]
MRSRRRARIGLAALVVGGVLAVFGWYKLFRQEPIPYTTDLAYFKYGSVGVEAANGLPYALWTVLPSVFPDLMGGPGGYARFGFLYEPGQATPIGLPVMTVGFPRIGINCGLCHIGSVRVSAAAPPQLLIGAPNSTLDLQRYFRFLFAAAADPRFNADVLIPAMARQHPVPLIDRLLLRFLIIPQVRSALLEQRRQLWWMDTVPDWGPGRVDPFNPAKVQLVHLPWDGSIGAARMVPLWNWNQRHNFGLHRDGLNTSLTEIFLNSGIGNGATNSTINLAGLARLQTWIGSLKPPAYPFPIDPALAAKGEPIFRTQCAGCHAFGGDKVGEPIPLAWVRTDRHRLDSWTTQARDGFNGLSGYDWRYSHFRKTGGYMSQALDGLWARAPFLHNGSVPSLADLLKAPADRPKTFYVGYDVYDQRQVGFVSAGPDAAAAGRLFDTALPGNGNAGHLYGTGLSDTDKRALLEYLKTL